MTFEPDMERVVTWLGEDPARMPDGFLDRVVGRIEAVPQSRLARLRTRVFGVNLDGRLVAAALAMVVVVAVVGGTILSRLPAVGVLPSPSPSVVPSASPSNGPSASAQEVVDLARLQATWRSVGTRPIPYKDDSLAMSTDLVIGPGTMSFWSVGDELLNSVALIGSGRLQITSETGPDRYGFKCELGDLGMYVFSLSATGSRLSLTSVSDACPGRAAVLAGDWDHTNLGLLAPGRQVAATFRPFGGGTSGQLSYAVPTGWKEQVESQHAFAVSGPDAAVLTWVSVLSDVIPSTADKDCGGPAAAAVERTPTEVAAWLAALPGLVVTKPTPVTIGGLDGVMVDVSVAKSWIEPCTTPPQPGTDVTTFVDASSDDVSATIGGETRERYILLDRGGGQTLLIDIEAQDAATWPAVLAAAMPVVNTFEFDR